MAADNAEQDKSESATPFKLDKARQRGMLARGTDLGFATTLLALAIIAQIAGGEIVRNLVFAMRQGFHAAARGQDQEWIAHFAGQLTATVLATLAVPALLLVALIAAVEIVQNRGIVFTAAPLKPDFTRLNPAKGLKRLFSKRMLKELGKNVLKTVIYGTALYLFIHAAMAGAGEETRSARTLASHLVAMAGRLLLLLLLLAAGIAVIDQVLARRSFAQQMRMSRRDVTREAREREGEPRQKRKRKQIMAELLKQAAGAAQVKGADVLIVNPVHYAVALRYRDEEDAAPTIVAAGRNAWALRMRRAAERAGVPIIRQPGLARQLYRDGTIGKPIGQAQFVAVADIYILLRRTAQAKATSGTI